jgi:6-pyruvoyl-tetrahydropterin synthase
MYSVKIREHMMIAHSLPDPFFGPAKEMHGATYVVDAEFFSPTLNAHQVVLDIGFAHEALKGVLKGLNYRNLDEIPEFSEKLTTTEFLAKYVHDTLKKAVNRHFGGQIKVTLHESHVASAAYDGRSDA